MRLPIAAALCAALGCSSVQQQLNTIGLEVWMGPTNPVEQRTNWAFYRPFRRVFLGSATTDVQARIVGTDLNGVLANVGFTEGSVILIDRKADGWGAPDTEIPFQGTYVRPGTPPIGGVVLPGWTWALVPPQFRVVDAVGNRSAPQLGVQFEPIVFTP